VTLLACTAHLLWNGPYSFGLTSNRACLPLNPNPTPSQSYTWREVARETIPRV